MIKKTISTLSATLLISTIIFIGYLAQTDNWYVIPLGISSALLVPLAFTIMSWAFRGEETAALKKLAKVPQIEDLIQKAESQEEKIKLLQEERNRLAEIIESESRRQTLEYTKRLLEGDMLRIITDYKATEEEMEYLDLKLEDSIGRREIKRIQVVLEERQKGPVTIVKFGKNERRFYDNDFKNDVLSGIILLIIKLIEAVQSLNKKRT